MKKALLIPLAIIAVLATGAPVQGDTKLKAPWVDRNYLANNDPFTSILVIGVPDRPDKRRSLEDKLVEALQKAGIEATASLDIMSADTEVNRDTVVAALAGKAVDGVFLTSLYRVEDVEVVSGGQPSRTQRSDREFKLLLWQDYQGTYDQTLNAPTSKKHQLVLENELYDLESEKIVWAVESYSMNPKSADEVIKSLSKQIGGLLRGGGLI